MAGRVGEEKIELIVRIQAIVKGYITRHRLRKNSLPHKFEEFVRSIPEKYPKYSKVEVQEIWKKLGPFEFN